MPPGRKRRGSHSTDGRNDSEDTSSLSGMPVSKRQKLVMSDQLAVCQDLYEILRNERTEEGQLLCEPFLKLPKKKSVPEYYSAVANPIDMTIIQQKIKAQEYEDVEQMSTDIELLVNNAKSFYQEDSLEYQQVEALWDLFCESRSRINEDETVDDNDDDENSRLSSATDDVIRSVLACADTGAECPKVPVLKLKVASYVEGASVISGDPIHSSVMTPSNECSSDFDAASESQSTNQGRLSSCSEIDEQAPNELPRLVIKQPRRLVKPGQTMGLRERRYAYRDFITPKQTRRKMQETIGVGGKQQDAVPVEEETTENVYEQLFSTVMSAMDGNRSLCEAFKVLPLRSKYIDYYQVIKEPIDLRMIAQKIQSNGYSCLEDMYKDLMLMTQNAKTFNKPTSTIYKDAAALRKIFTSRKHELELPSKVTPPIVGRVARIRTRGTAGAANGPSMSATIAALRGESEDEDTTNNESDEVVQTEIPVFCNEDPTNGERDSDDEESASGDESSDLWTLLKYIMNYRTNIGLRLAEPFIRLPSKRMYPDYYLEIKKPLSMTKIKKKLKNGRYHDLDQIASDLNHVFENAKQYNLEESKIYKDAVKLQGMMNVKKQELQRAKDALWEQSSNRSRQATPDTGGEESGQKKKRSRSTSSDEALKKRLFLIFKFINDYQFDGRRLIDIFKTLPLKKDYPDYYKVISEPIDMTMIENKIKSDKYSSQQALVDDLELMFKNARHYNEETSLVYKDAETLERQLHSRLRTLLPLDDSPTAQARSSFGRQKKLQTLPAKLQELYNNVRDYTDSRGRTLSTPFMKVPPRNEYPDYYEVIRKPIDMQKVMLKINTSQYNGVEELVSDFVLMFDNACKYNEPDSLIYKDALTLQRVCLSKKAELITDDDSNEIPDVPALIQALMMNLFSSTYSHMDEEGRCFSDSFLELPARLPSDGSGSVASFQGAKSFRRLLPCILFISTFLVLCRYIQLNKLNGGVSCLRMNFTRSAPSFEQVKYNLDKGRYKRLDRFQEDMFEVFEYARKISNVDAQVYEDSIELQLYFIKQRDELCNEGELLRSPALNYTDVQLKEMLDSLCLERASKEQKDEEEHKKQAAALCEADQTTFAVSEIACDSFEYKGQIYHVGDFVYIEPRDRDKGLVPQIVCIERLDKLDDGETMIYGCWFLRPNETFHLTTRKFLQKELFKSDFYDRVSFSKVIGKCYVMFVKEYFKNKPEGFKDSDVYVCESRYYTARGKCFKKIKIWQSPKNEHVKVVPRDNPLTPVRVASVFADVKSMEAGGIVNGTFDRMVDLNQTSVLDKQRENVRAEIVAKSDEVSATEDECVYYEQLQAPACWLKLGDCVYLKSPGSRNHPMIMHIKKLWTSPSAETFLSGVYFMTPSQVEHMPTRLFYKNEVVKSSREGIHPVSHVLGRCAVMSMKEYCTSRCTEIPESDVFISDSKFIDAEKTIKKFSKVLRRVVLSDKVCEDEVYFFKKPITVQKELSPLLPKALDVGSLDEESMDCPSVDQSFNDAGSCQGENTMDSLPASNKKRKSSSKAINKARQISGYIVFAAECRKDIQAEYPGQTFGDISRIVGYKWKGLPKEVKDRYEDKARAIAADHAAKMSNNPIVVSSYPPGSGALQSPGPGAESPHHMQAYGGFNPAMSGGTPGYNQAMSGGTPGYNPAMSGGSVPCSPYPGSAVPFSHHQQQMMSSYPPGTPYNGQIPHSVAAYNMQPMRFQNGYQGPMVQPVPPKPPIFTSVPPRTQRLVHTETYLRYIEGLSIGSQSVGEWEKSLNAKAPDNMNGAGDKLPVHWLGNGAGHHENTVSALWALRDLMMKDAMTISRTLDFSQV